MDLNLKYGEIYNLKIADKEYKGIYLGKRVPRVRLKSKHVILVNKPTDELLSHPYSLIIFKDYRFNEDNKLILQRMHCINPASNEGGYLEELSEKFG